ncbi:MAG TPA: hypothetical protein VNK03_00170 [Gammaproteobacteria bacterium]|nr:hypothetical protein [Gammaproteobacteria bacterium]
MSVNTNEFDINDKFRKYKKASAESLFALLNTKNEDENRFFGSNAATESIKERGESYIDAAILIVENSAEAGKAEQLKKLEDIKTNWQKNSFDVAIKSDPFYLRYIDARIQYIENSTLDPEPKRKEIESLELMKSKWEAKEVDKKKLVPLHELLGELCEEIRPCVGKNSDIEKLLKNLNNAENHVNWKTREPLRTIVDLGEDVIQVRIDEPITEFTKEQEKEWERILLDKKEQPNWFKKLQPWEQKHFQEKVNEWKQKKEGPPKLNLNLGTHMGVPPTTIRGYPGARNAYTSDIITYKRDPKNPANFIKINQVRKIRSGHISPSKMKKTKERVAAAQANLEQLILAGIRNDLKANPGKSDFIVDLQTLITPPLSPADNEMDLDRLQAIKNLREKFKKTDKEDGFGEFLREYGIKTKEVGTGGPTIQLITSNYPVNKMRAVSNFLAPLKVIPGLSHIISLPELISNLKNNDPPIEKFKSTGKWVFSFAVEGYRGIKRARENNNTLKALHETKDYLLQRHGPGAPLPTELKMAADALDKIKAMSGPMQRARNFAKRGINHNAERAALEQIAVSGLGGIRIGSCMSGKDREGAVSEHVAAMTAFHAKYGQFPPIPPTSRMDINDELRKKFPNKTEKDFRKEYEGLVAKQFLSCHDQKIAEQNAKGAKGLKSPGDVLGKNVSKQAHAIILERHPDTKSKEHYELTSPSELSNRSAKLNRAHTSKVEKASKKKKKKLKKQVLTGDKHAEPKKISKTEPEKMPAKVESAKTKSAQETSKASASAPIAITREAAAQMRDDGWEDQERTREFNADIKRTAEAAKADAKSEKQVAISEPGQKPEQDLWDRQKNSSDEKPGDGWDAEPTQELAQTEASQLAAVIAAYNNQRAQPTDVSGSNSTILHAADLHAAKRPEKPKKRVRFADEEVSPAVKNEGGIDENEVNTPEGIHPSYKSSSPRSP